MSVPLLARLLISAVVAASLKPQAPRLPDRDSDTIPDVRDKCPDDPEDLDGWQDDDGCPDPDNDGDGILDVDDLCPNELEDKDGFEDEDGCPDPDNDKDRILDVDDKCPNEPETYNGFQDDDGCPDQSDVKVWVCPGGILDHIFFRRDAARVEAVSLPIVDVVAKTLLANPDINLVEVIGHASRDERDGLRLSTRRANAVTAELVHRGVQATRLTGRGYGSSEPLDRARTKAANEKNRRVEFVVKRRDGKQIVIIR